MRKASRIYKRKSRSNLETFIILIGAIIILGVAFNLARDRSYIPPEEPTIVQEEKTETPVTKVPAELIKTETVGKAEEKEIFPAEEIKKEVTPEEKPPLTEPSVIKTSKTESEVEVVKESEIVSDKKVHTIQVGAFSKEEGAQKLAKEIRDKGYQTYVIIGKTLYKVQVGEFNTLDEAKEISEKLKKLGYEIWITTR